MYLKSAFVRRLHREVLPKFKILKLVSREPLFSTLETAFTQMLNCTL